MKRFLNVEIFEQRQECNILRDEEVKAESVKILRRMGVNEELIRDFEKFDEVSTFENGAFMGLNKKSVLKWLCKELKVPYKPYAITIDTVQYMKMINFLYCSPYREDLEYMCRPGLCGERLVVYAYCYNVDFPELSESGTILVEIKNGCIRRVS